MANEPLSEQKSAHRLAFEHYLRTGEQLTTVQWLARYESKFNQNHDERGRFTFSNQGVAMGQGAAGGRTARQRQPGTVNRGVPQSKPANRNAPRPSPSPRQHDIGALSAKYESSGDPGTISSGRNDPGGVSYGTHQLSSRGKMVDAFIASPMAARWSVRFRNLRPATPAFDQQWRAIASSEPTAFEEAQRAFLGRENYNRVVNGVAREAGVNLNGAANAVRQVTWSVAVQHGGAKDILSTAVQRTDRALRRTDPRYQRTLIENIYDERIAYTERVRQRRLSEGKIDEARGLENVIRNRFPSERSDALKLFDGR